MKSPIFYEGIYHQIEDKVKEFINNHSEFLSSATIQSPRAVGDAIELLVRNEFETILGNLSQDYSAQYARRSMADMAFTDPHGFYYIIDVKTHRTDTHFNMPNLTSVRRLARFYEDSTNYFVVLFISYHVTTRPVVTQVQFIPIEFLSWDCLTIGALGWGQIQITNANRIIVTPESSRKQWMLEMCHVLFEFYPREIAKITERIDFFENVRDFWLAMPDD
ncbi:MAG: hypothetical protein GXP38_12380 [Chloroflexi bacterium]|nr:hypothetical protein [Chloroflexota bacterium]